MTALLAIGGKILGVAWPYLLGAAAILGIYGYGHHQGYAGEHAKFETYKAEAIQRTTEIVNEQVRIRDEAEKQAQEKHNALLRSFADHEAAAKLVPSRSDPALSGAARRVLLDAIDTTNSPLYARGISPKTETATATPGDTAGADQGTVLDWAIECSKLYGEAVVQILGLQDYVDKLRASTQRK